MGKELKPTRANELVNEVLTRVQFSKSGHNRAARKGPWKLLVSGSEITRLCNVEENPGESKDFSAEYENVVKKLKNTLNQWKQDKPEPQNSARKIKTNFNGDAIDWHI